MDINPGSWNALRYSNTLTRMDGVLDITELVALFKFAGFGIPLSNQLATALLLWYNKHPKDGVLSMKEIVAACKGGKKVLLS